jgi:hypothetical protein
VKRSILSLVADVVAVLVFCAIGRRSHDESGALAGLVHTAWPFLSGLGIGWVATIALYRDKFVAGLVVPTGISVWLSTLIFGMLLRVVSGQGTAFTFILVAATVLAVFLLGWRGVLSKVGLRGGKVIVYERGHQKH